MRKRIIAGLASSFVVAQFAGCGGSDDGSPAPTPAAPVQRACADVGSFSFPNVTLQAPQAVAAGTTRPAGVTSGDFLPAHCIVRGVADAYVGTDSLDHGTGFELRLPENWSGQFFFQGGGGNDGTIRPAVGTNTGSLAATQGTAAFALARGFAVVSTDGGHEGTDAASYGLDQQARVNHAYASYDRTTQLAKQIITQYYGRGPAHSYFVGCSGGGRQGMMFSQRFPTYFDGIVASAPAMRVASGASISAANETIAYTRAAPRDPAGNPILSQALTDADLNLLSGAILQACDAKDGLIDGLISNAPSCSFDPAVLQCTGAKSATCLSAAQVTAVKTAFAGPKNSAAQPLYASWPWDSGIGTNAPNWRQWKLGTSTTAVPNSQFVTLIQNATAYEFLTPADPTYNMLNINFDTDPARFNTESSIYDTYRTTDLSPYTGRGGKLIFFHGGSDPIFSPNDTIDYYQRVGVTAGGAANESAFARLFIVPGMNHCSGGPATDAYDGLAAIVNWVENGRAPDSVTASTSTTTAFASRTRPLCPYPQYAHYKGSGSVDDAANFTCAP